MEAALGAWHDMGLQVLPEPSTNTACGGAGRARGEQTSRGPSSKPAATLQAPNPFSLSSNYKNRLIVSLMAAPGQEAVYCRDVLHAAEYDYQEALGICTGAQDP